MKYLRLCILIIFLIPSSVFAAKPFYSELNNAQRFDLADAYSQVADIIEKLGQTERAENYRDLGKQIFPDSTALTTSPDTETEKSVADNEEKVKIAYSSAQATSYYFTKLIRALNEENLSLTLSILASRLYIPGHENGIEMPVVTRGIEKFFKNYNLQSVTPENVFYLNNKSLERIPNNTWRLSVPIKESYQRILAPPFQGNKVRLYFRKLPVGLATDSPGYNQLISAKGDKIPHFIPTTLFDIHYLNRYGYKAPPVINHIVHLP